MSTKDWDQTFVRLVEQIGHLERPFSPRSIPLLVTIHQKRSAIGLYQQATDRVIAGFKSRKNLVLKSELQASAILHWAITIGESWLGIYRKQSSLLAKSLWIALIRCRLIGGKQTGLLIEDTDLLEMGTRELALKADEKTLLQRLVQMRENKRRLYSKIQQLETRSANKDASGCLQQNFYDRGQKEANLVQKALSSFINNLSVTARTGEGDGAHLKQLQTQLRQETDQVIDDCRNMMSKDISPDRMTVGRERVAKLCQDIEKLTSLQQKVAQLSQEVCQEIIPNLHPTLTSKQVHRSTSSPKS